jgi:heme/copper-type cytochrome/quinol oxidase subunit 4
MIKNLGGRKFIYSLLITFLAFILVLVGKIESESFLKFVTGIGAIYTAGNTVSKFGK